DLLGIASARKLTLQIGHIERFNAAFRKALGSAGGIKDPVLIECRRWAPFTSRGADVDVVLDLMIHDLDLALALAGAPVHDVQAFLESVATGAPPLVSGREGAAALKLAYDVMARIAGTAHDT